MTALRDALEAIAESGGELVRRRRPATEGEYASILATGDPAGDTIEEWVAPIRNAPWTRQREPAVICDGLGLARLVHRGFVALVAGGTRALLTDPGRRAAAAGPGGDSKAGGEPDGAEVAQGDETASEGCCGPSAGAGQ